MSHFLTVVSLIVANFTAIAGAYASLRKKASKTDNTIQDIHVLVNSRMAEMVKRVDMLTGTLNDAGVQVPPDVDS